VVILDELEGHRVEGRRVEGRRAGGRRVGDRAQLLVEATAVVGDTGAVIVAEAVGSFQVVLQGEGEGVFVEVAAALLHRRSRLSVQRANQQKNKHG
jgi:hypothetical protein